MQQPTHPDRPVSAESFPTDPTGLPEATPPELQELADGDTFDLGIGPVAKRLGDTTVRMLGYNGSIPGPTLKVAQGSEVVVHVTNDGDLEATVHAQAPRTQVRLAASIPPPAATAGTSHRRASNPEPVTASASHQGLPAPLPPGMIRSRAAVSRTPAAPLRAL